MTSFIASDGHLLSMAVIEGAGVGGSKSLGLWGAGPDWAFIRKIEKLNTKSPRGGGGSNSLEIWEGPPVGGHARLSAEFRDIFFLEGGVGVVMETGKQRGEN